MRQSILAGGQTFKFEESVKATYGGQARNAMVRDKQNLTITREKDGVIGIKIYYSI